MEEKKTVSERAKDLLNYEVDFYPVLIGRGTKVHIGRKRFRRTMCGLAIKAATTVKGDVSLVNCENCLGRFEAESLSFPKKAGID